MTPDELQAIRDRQGGNRTDVSVLLEALDSRKILLMRSAEWIGIAPGTSSEERTLQALVDDIEAAIRLESGGIKAERTLIERLRLDISAAHARLIAVERILNAGPRHIGNARARVVALIEDLAPEAWLT